MFFNTQWLHPRHCVGAVSRQGCRLNILKSCEPWHEGNPRCTYCPRNPGLPLSLEDIQQHTYAPYENNFVLSKCFGGLNYLSKWHKAEQQLRFICGRAIMLSASGSVHLQGQYGSQTLSFSSHVQMFFPEPTKLVHWRQSSKIYKTL